MLVAVAWATVIAAGALIFWRGARPPQTPLAAALDDLHRPRRHDAAAASSWWVRTAGAAGSVTVGNADRHCTDLAVVDRTAGRHALDKAGYATAALALPAAIWVLFAAAGETLPAGIVAFSALAAMAAGFFYPDAALARAAAARRREFRWALGAFVDLTAILLAGGAGPEGALDAAAATGTGWPFELLRRDLATARLTRTSPWATFADTAERLDLAPFAALASTVGLAGDSGAKVRDSLTAKARTLADAELADAQADAEAATEAMSGPVVIMLAGFVLLVGYPAIANIVAL